MNDLMTQSLAQIVNNDYRTAAVLERYQLDFCCKGKRSLQKACAEGSVPVGNVLSDLEKLAVGSNFALSSRFGQLTLAQLCDYIVNMHHSYVRNEMPAIHQYLIKVASKHGDRHPELYTILELFTPVMEEMQQHMQKEELILFPRIKEVEDLSSQGGSHIDAAYLLAPIEAMETEHDHAGTALSSIRKLTNDFMIPVDACTTFRLLYHSLQAFEADLHQHVHLENNILFPKALKMSGQKNIAG